MKIREFIKGKRIKRALLTIGICTMLAGCTDMHTLGSKSEKENPVESEKSESANEQLPHTEPEPYDFTEHIEKKHKILAYDICSEPRYDYENTPLKDYLASYVEEDRRLREKISSLPTHETDFILTELKIDYHIFDFNDDGLEDYLVCIGGAGYGGSAGNVIEIYIQEPDGQLRKVLDILMRLWNEELDDGHEVFTVLDEKADGYYAIVTVESYHILRYEKESGRYEFHDGE